MIHGRVHTSPVRTTHRSSPRRAKHARSLRFEPLEERRLLAITVNTLVDENDGIAVGGISLRDAIAAAVPGDTIDFAPSLTPGGLYVMALTEGSLYIKKVLNINAPGPNLLEIEVHLMGRTPSSSDHPIFFVRDIFFGFPTADLNITISGLR